MSRESSSSGSGRLSRLAGYGASRTTVEGLLGIRGIVLARILGPTLFGVWTLFRLGLKYGAFAALGVHRGLEVEVAASGDERASGPRPWGRAAVGYLYAVYGAIGVLFVAASFVVDSPARETLGAVAVGLLVERLWIYGSSYLRAEGRLKRFGLVELAQAALSLLLTLLLALTWGLVGAYAGFLAALVAGILLLGRSVPFRPTVTRERVATLLGVGVPLSIASIARTLLSTVDRIIVVGLEDTETLGLYAFAVAVSGIGASAVWVVRTVVFPEVYARARNRGGREAAATHLDDTIVPVMHLLPPLLGVVALALGPAIVLVAPEYVSVVPVARIFIFAGAASGIMSLGTLGLVATERQAALPLVAFGGLALNALTAVGALLAGLGLVGVATGALVSRALTGLGTVAISTGASGPRELGRLALRVLGPGVWCAAGVVVVGWWRPGIGWATTAGSTLLYVAVLLPLAPGLVRQVRRLGRLDPGEAG